MPPVLEEVSVDSNIISSAITATVEVVKEKLGLVDNQDALQSSLSSQEHVNFVEWTALLSAVARAVESKQADSILSDSLSSLLLQGSQKGEELQEQLSQALLQREATHGPPRFALLASIRTRIIDDMLTSALHAQQSQLAAATTPVQLLVPDNQANLGADMQQQIDKDDVLKFKRAQLLQAGAALKAHQHSSKFPLKAAHYTATSADLTDAGWSTHLKEAGWQPGRPTVWVAEGLMYFLTPEAASGLLQELHSLSSPGSSLILSHFTERFLNFAQATAVSDISRELASSYKSVLPIECTSYLRRQGWVLNESTDLVQKAADLGVKLFGDAHLTDEQLSSNSDYKVLLCNKQG